MNYDKIIFPNVETFYIFENNGAIVYGSVMPENVLSTKVPIEDIQQFTDVSLWKAELALHGITVEDNN